MLELDDDVVAEVVFALYRLQQRGPPNTCAEMGLMECLKKTTTSSQWFWTCLGCYRGGCGLHHRRHDDAVRCTERANARIIDGFRGDRQVYWVDIDGRRIGPIR